MGTKRRVIPYEGSVGGWLRSRAWTSIGLAQDSTNLANNLSAFSSLNGYQITDSENHPEFRTLERGKWKGDLGGPFTTRKAYAFCTSGAEDLATSGGFTDPQTKNTYLSDYVGPILPCSPTFLQWPSFNYSSDSALNQLGTTAIARCSPSNPSANLTESVGEIVHDGLPSAIGDKLFNLRSLTPRQRKRAIGDEYLNYQFGWVPFISDLKDISKSIVHADPILDQYERDSGKLVRRGYRFPEVFDTKTEVFLENRSPWMNPSGSNLFVPTLTNKGQVIRSEYSAKRQWFKGAFTYYVPPAKGLRNNMARAVIQARHLLGLSLTPDSVWNLAPWSWAIDWFSNAGDVLSNWTSWAIDNQVLWYGYMMEHSIHVYRYTFVGETGLRSRLQPPDVYLVAETKLRRKATPYGFGLSWDSFTTRQKAIIAALGISRSK